VDGPGRRWVGTTAGSNVADDSVRVFLFTHIDGSTRRWERRDIAMPEALAEHDAILAGAIAAAQGEVFKHLGDGMAAT
jgi:class 3 adenylate cyclase